MITSQIIDLDKVNETHFTLKLENLIENIESLSISLSSPKNRHYGTHLAREE